jgi:hypothetical protein
LAIFREIHQVQGFIDFDRGKFGLEASRRRHPEVYVADAANSFARAVGASLIAAANSRTVGAGTSEQIARSRWPADRNVATILKAASAPAQTTVAGWADVVAHVGQVIDIIATLAPASVAAALLKRCMNFTWPQGVYQMAIPTMAVNPAATGWVGEGAPIPVWDFTTSSVPLTPKKIGAICMFTQEMIEHSTPNIEQLTRAVLAESLGLALDNSLLSAAAGDANTPPGIFAGINPISPSSNTIPSEAMTEDISRVIATCAPVAGNNPIILAMSPRQATAMKVRADIGQFEVYSSAALPNATCCAIATNVLASVGDAAPTFRSSFESPGHMETQPQPIGSATPAKQPYQTDCVLLRITFSLNWVLRNSAGGAWVKNVLW